MASTDWVVHIELMGQDRELLERVNENIEWYRKHLEEQEVQRKLAEKEARVQQVLSR